MKSQIVMLTLLLMAALPAGAQEQTLNDGWTCDGAPVRLPHTWNTDAYTVKDYRRGTGVYERTLTVADTPADRRLYLRIDAACKVARVYVADRLALTHQGGYAAFTVDLTPYLRPGDNRLRIEVDNDAPDVPPTSADFTFMGGLYRDVWLIEKPLCHFDLLRPLDIVSDTTGISILPRLSGNVPPKKTLELRLYAPDGRLLGSRRQRLKGQPRCERFALRAAEVQLWSPEHPSLYRVEALLYGPDGRTVSDRAVRHTGVRFYGFDAERGFMLNGQPYKLRGVCRHQDQQPYGVALSDDMHRRDFNLIKQMGANFIRLAHYPQDDAFLDECDRRGLLVWEETPIVNTVPAGDAFADHCAEQLREMISNHRHHTSIILWGYMNEILLETNRIYKGAEHDAAVGRTLALAQRLDSIVQAEDPTRLSVMAFHGSDDYNRVGLGDVPQVVGWNLYQGWYGSRLSDFEAFLGQQHRDHSDHPLIVSEYGAGSDLRLHCPDGGQAFDFSMDYQQRYVEHYLPVLEQTPWVVGGAYWNFIDFSSAVRDESMPRINNKGLVTAQRTPKDVYYYFQALWTAEPMVHIATRDWPERSVATTADAVTMPVKVYTNQPSVELYVDGQSLGRREAANCTAVFDVPFSEGRHELRAVAAAAVDAHVVSLSMPRGEWAVNVGSRCFFQSTKSGMTWQPDRPYTPGQWGYLDGEPAQTQTQIQLTDDGPLYQSQRRHLSAYRFDVPAGDYELELLMADIDHRSQQAVYLLGKGEDQLSVAAPLTNSISVNGRVIEPSFLPVRPFTAERRRYHVTTTADSLVITFTPAATVAAIKLRRLEN